jgi:Spy/CpxP family protein refolding chaperone
MNRPLKIALVFTGIFLCGVVVGAVAARRYAHANPPPRALGGGGGGEEGFGPRTLRRLGTELKLSDEQRAAIKPIVQKAGEDLRRLRKESMQQTTGVFEAMDALIVVHLTPEQRERFTELKAAQRQRMKTYMEERQRRFSEGERREDAEHPPRPDAPPPPRQEKDSH